ncbi:MAG: class I SAM-dependent methyltransferase [Bacteroidota bacterium]
MHDVFGKALIDYQNGKYTEDIITISSVAGIDLMTLPYLFRSYDKMPAIEQTALNLCKGSVLDVGCGSGSHSLHLQKKNHTVKAIDISRGAIEVSRLRGVKNAIVKNIYDLEDEKFNTILLLMNGVGICGKINNLNFFLDHLKSLLFTNGQILLDSSNIIYMFDKKEDYIVKNDNYNGEVTYTMEYKNKESKPFDWLFLDFDTLQKYAHKIGLKCELVIEGEHYDYLAKLTMQE